MYNTLKRLYREGRLTERGLTNAITLEWITEKQKEQIIATKG